MKKKNFTPDVCPEGMTIADWQINLRRQAAEKGQFIIHELPDRNVPGAFAVVSPKTQSKYRVLYHGTGNQWNSCDCMDFRTNGLGTCKHIEAVEQWLTRRGRKADARLPRNSGIDVLYSPDGRKIRLRTGSGSPEELSMAAMRYFDDAGIANEGIVADIPTFIDHAKRLEPRFHCTADALNLILEERDRRRRHELAAAIEEEEIAGILSARLLPYQCYGVRFAFRAGRSLIADQMGLGKTIEALATAQLFKKYSMVASVVVVCPSSLKYQWKKEIERFTGESVVVIEGVHTRRRQMYDLPAMYKIVSYHTLANDMKAIGSLNTDLLIMDEVQRLKNWNTQIARAARRIESEYAVILSGTPLENRIEELYSVMQFVDQYALGPYHYFMQRSIIKSDTGKVTGYRDLHTVSERLSECMIRRTKSQVALQLPERRDKVLFVTMTAEQQAIHNDAQSTVAQLANKWQRQRFLSEKDRKRLLLTLGQMRMVCDSTYILDQHTRFGSKLSEVMEIIDNARAENEKVVVFSQWERMTRLVAEELDRLGIDYEYLHGGIPSHRRGAMTERFSSDPACTVFLSTDAGSTGLNLQAASTIVNIDLPWNPAVLEQRIARIHRIGQHHNIQVINLVAADTIEERMLTTLDFKRNLFEGIFDGGDDSITLDDNRLTRLAAAVATLFDEAADEETEAAPAADTASEAEASSDAEASADAEVASDTQVADKNTEEEGKRRSSQTQGTESQDNPAAILGTALSALGRTLASEEGRKALVDSIVTTDSEGHTELRIPIENKETVATLLTAISRLFTSK